MPKVPTALLLVFALAVWVLPAGAAMSDKEKAG